MAQIERIVLNVQTGKLSGAGTDGDVYLGVCGREFSIDTTRDDFERESTHNYILGDGSNVNNSSLNDPRKQRLFVENVESFPVYIRFQPQNGSDDWQLHRASVRFNDDVFPAWDTASFVLNDPTEGIWLGTRSGLVVHLPKQLENATLR